MQRRSCMKWLFMHEFMCKKMLPARGWERVVDAGPSWEVRIEVVGKLQRAASVRIICFPYQEENP